MADDRLDRIEAEIRSMQLRNARVEADKAWETSVFRRMLIAGATYVVACVFLFTIGMSQPWVHACVPTGGYLLSTLSLPAIKRWWCARRYAD
jgi:hypothetical protein